MTEMRELKCNNEVVKEDGKIQCNAICSVHFMEVRCCGYCNEIKRCKRVCGFMRKKK